MNKTPNFRCTDCCYTCVHANLERTDHLNFLGCQKYPDQKWSGNSTGGGFWSMSSKNTVCDSFDAEVKDDNK